MKKIIIIIWSILFSGNLFSQNDAIYTARDTAYLLKPTVFNTARFLSYRGAEFTLDKGAQMTIPGLTHSFSLTKQTLVQISQTVNFSTSSCFTCVEAFFNVWIYIDDLPFARLTSKGSDKSMSLSGTSLAQLGPGEHTIRLDVSGVSNSVDISIHGVGSHIYRGGAPRDAYQNGVYNDNLLKANVTYMSLLFFPQE